MRKRPITITVRFNEEEYKWLMDNVNKSCLRREPYIRSLIAGEEIYPGQSYRVATLDYLLEGNDKMLAFRKGTDIVAPTEASNNTRYLIMNYFKEKLSRGETVDAQIEGRIKIK